MAATKRMSYSIAAVLMLLLIMSSTFTFSCYAEVRVSTTPIRAAIARDQRKDDFEVLVTVEAPKVVAPEKRAPIDLVAVLDVSGSVNKEEFVRGKHMSSRLDLLKIAMKYIIKLVRDADRLAIVSFNHAVVSEYGLTRNSADSRKKLENLVDKLKASGNTAFRPALKKAAERIQITDC
uniref:von Willebrand factor type A domain containing protein-like n=1 Tax=Oryza nivara TaxID=4536 RepID=A0A679BB69_ORYNI|nr:von Willebrand factor type A domain containing protein-like [Oryza sativa f. spontanea]